ncbi:MAG: hypothetical protein HYZ44_13615 [Bacteroidetes bacterium]|nr:hypothetical protein [Bacteroidota bacterium]
MALFQCGIYQSTVKKNAGSTLHYKILRIDSTENVYCIYAMRNDSVFKILEKKEARNNCHRIVVDKDYDLKISSIFLPEELHVKMRVAGIKFEGVMVNMEEEGVIRDLFTASNLIGTCYVFK